MRKQFLSIFILFLFGFLFIGGTSVYAQNLTLYTPYTGISVTPGESISYDVDVINDSSSVQHTTFSLNNLPKDWDYSIRSGGNTLRQLSVRPGDEESFTLEVDVPLEVDKGDYNFTLEATDGSGETATLPFVVTVSEKGTFKTEFNVEQPNMEGHAESDFSYSAELKNFTADEQHYSLSAKAPEGWSVQFKADGDSVTSVSVEPGETEDVTIDVTPPENVTADTYEIPVIASSGSTDEEVTLEAVITGKYDIELTTPSGNVSSSVTAGKSRTIDLVIENTGTIEVSDLELSASTPPNWDVSFEEETIPVIEADDSVTVKAKLTAPDDAIAGDYVTTFEAQSSHTSADTDFRISVKTSTLWGIVAVGIIVIVIACLYVVFKKFGRR